MWEVCVCVCVCVGVRGSEHGEREVSIAGTYGLYVWNGRECRVATPLAITWPLATDYSRGRSSDWAVKRKCSSLVGLLLVLSTAVCT